jgi:hypothetical protein
MSSSELPPVPSSVQSPEELRACLARLRGAATELAGLPLTALLGRLARLGELWRPGGECARQARELLAGPFQPRAVDGALAALAASLNAPTLAAALHQELGRVGLLDLWAADETGTGLVRAYPLGVVAQVLAGNVFLGGAMALAHALLSRNAVLLKLSREDAGFTALFARSLVEADEGGPLAQAVAVCAWDSGRDELNSVLREEADAVVVWGGEAAVSAYPAGRCRGRVIHHGPRLGVGFLLEGADALAELAWDVALWEQQACSSPRLLFVEGVADRARAVARRLAEALTAVRGKLPSRPLSLDDKSEVLTVRERAWWGEGAELFVAPGSMGHTVLLYPELPRAVPVGYRTVLVVPLARLDAVAELLAPYRALLQTAVLAAPPARWPDAVDHLVRAGFTQVAAAGSAASRFLGLPHEGEFSLRRLVRLVGVDLGAGPLVYPGRGPEMAAAVGNALRGVPGSAGQ